jgi:hypothetical protein
MRRSILPIRKRFGFLNLLSWKVTKISIRKQPAQFCWSNRWRPKKVPVVRPRRHANANQCFSNGIGGHNYGNEFHSARATSTTKNINLKRALQKSGASYMVLGFAVSREL